MKIGPVPKHLLTMNGQLLFQNTAIIKITYKLQYGDSSNKTYLGPTEKVIINFIINSYNEFSRTKCKCFK